MFGDEPYGNYNRILLSGVLAGTQQPEDIFINPLAWYAEQRRHAARRRRASTRIDREAQVVHGARRPRRALRHAGHRHRQRARSCRRSRACARAPTAACKPGVFVFRTLDDCARIAGYAPATRSAPP